MDSKAYKNMKRERSRMTRQRLFRNKTAVAGVIFLILLIIATAAADLYLDYNKDAIQMSEDMLQSPNSEHWFGTDHLGRDMFAMIVFGARYSLSIGFLVAAITLALGIVFGSCAAFFGGKVDNIIMRIMDVLICIPGVLLTLAVIAAMGTSYWVLVIAMTITSIASSTRMVRAIVFNTVGKEYIEAARANGMPEWKIIIYHIMPNSIGPVIVQGSMYVASFILTAAGMSFLGMGIQPPTPEWGRMLSESVTHMRNHPYLVIFPGIMIVLASLSFNLFGDGLRDALDPTLKD